MHLAIINEISHIIWVIIRLAPAPWLLDLKNDDAQAPIHLAALTKQSNVVRRLLVAGANVRNPSSSVFLLLIFSVEKSMISRRYSSSSTKFPSSKNQKSHPWFPHFVYFESDESFCLHIDGLFEETHVKPKTFCRMFVFKILKIDDFFVCFGLFVMWLLIVTFSYFSD